jgi:NAD(P)-dependent dehydrogenase (short-subunit alcohol dehydrogenase family)
MLDGRVALITGAARGLGLAIAETLAREGARLVLSDLDGEGLSAASAGLRSAGHEVRTTVGNVGVVADGEAMVREAVEGFGRLDILVNNAGGSAHTPLKMEDVTEEDFDRVMSWNVRGTFFCTKAALPALKVRGGSIVNMASISGRAGSELLSPQYSAAKAAIIGMTRNLAKHLGPHGIRVNAIAPGFIRSGERAEAIWRTRDESKVLDQVPLRRRGELSEIGDAALFLASDMSRYTTGCIIDVNGGYMTA